MSEVARPLARVTIRELTSVAQWRDLFARVDFPHMTQAWAFGEAKRATGWKPKRFVIHNNHEPIAIFQSLHKQFAGITIATRINQGPMMLEGHAAEAPEAHAAIRRRWRFLFRGALLISPTLEHSETAIGQLGAMGYRKRPGHGWASSRLNLTRGVEDLRKGLESTWRNRLKKSESHGLVVKITNDRKDMQWLLQKHVENMAQKDFEGPTAALVKGLYDAAPRDFFVFRIMRGDETVAGMGVARFGTVGQYYIGWFGEDGRPFNAGNFALWNVAMELKRLGCTQFDLGGHHRAVGFGKFKMGMNGEVYASAGEFVCF
jgi:hypothetical protein